METLNDTVWDVVIDGTDLPQSLLALALSRSGYRILHLDQNHYYGGKEAALSLDEAQEWAEKFHGQHGQYCRAKVTRPHETETVGAGLGASRAYTLSLGPQLIYGRSSLLEALVRSRTHEQLDFQAVGSFWVVDSSQDDTSGSRFVRVPSGREDIFQDKSISLRAKRSLVNFIRAITGDSTASAQSHDATETDHETRPFPDILEQIFRLPPETHPQLFALTLSAQPPNKTTYKEAVTGVKRHLLSMGMFGSGFGAVTPKYGGLSEVVQVACRAGAVGGGVYVLGKHINSSIASSQENSDLNDMKLELDDGEIITTRWLVRSADDTSLASSITMMKSISIVDSPLTQLFPPTSAEGGVTPAGAVVLIPGRNEHDPPIHIVVHSANSGECPQSQCVLYASMLSSSDRHHSVIRLDSAIDDLLRVLGAGSADVKTDPQKGVDVTPKVLWRLGWDQTYSTATTEDGAGSLSHDIRLSPLSASLALEDIVLDNVQSVWQTITGEDKAEFMKFAAREDGDDVGDSGSDM